jgi:hypothetical protein
MTLQVHDTLETGALGVQRIGGARGRQTLNRIGRRRIRMFVSGPVIRDQCFLSGTAIETKR